MTDQKDKDALALTKEEEERLDRTFSGDYLYYVAVGRDRLKMQADEQGIALTDLPEYDEMMLRGQKYLHHVLKEADDAAGQQEVRVWLKKDWQEKLGRNLEDKCDVEITLNDDHRSNLNFYLGKAEMVVRDYGLDAQVDRSTPAIRLIESTISKLREQAHSHGMQGVFPQREGENFCSPEVEVGEIRVRYPRLDSAINNALVTCHIGRLPEEQRMDYVRQIRDLYT